VRHFELELIQKINKTSPKCKGMKFHVSMQPIQDGFLFQKTFLVVRGQDFEAKSANQAINL